RPLRGQGHHALLQLQVKAGDTFLKARIRIDEVAVVIAPPGNAPLFHTRGHPVTNARADNQAWDERACQGGIHIPNFEGEIETVFIRQLLVAGSQQKTAFDIAPPVRQTQSDITPDHFRPPRLGLPGDHSFTTPERPALVKQLRKIQSQITASELHQPLFFSQPQVAVNTGGPRRGVKSGNVYATEISPKLKQFMSRL